MPRSDPAGRLLTLALTILVSTCAFAAPGGASAPPGAGPLSISIVQPEFLSLQLDSPLTVVVGAPGPSSSPVRVELRSVDGSSTTTVLQAVWQLHAGRNGFPLVVTPQQLGGFVPGEEVIVSVSLGATTVAVQTTALYGASAPEASSWALAFTSDPLSLSTSENTPVGLGVTNPKNKAKRAKIALSFLSGSGQTVAQVASTVSLPPGSSSQTVNVSSAVALQAKQGGAQQVRGTLKVGAATRATATASAAFGLTATASGIPLSGGAPLTVVFAGSASGGTPPYAYDWDFGDGSPHDSLQNPSHTYMSSGAYTAILSVTDSLSDSAAAPALAVTASSASNATLSAIQSALFTPRCTGCHGGNSPTAGMNLSAGQSYSNLVNVPSTTNSPMLRVKPFDPANSFLVIQLAGGHQSVSAADQQAIRDWVTSGAPNN